MKTRRLAIAGVLVILGFGMAGCAALEPLTSDETILNDTAALLGVAPADLTISNKRTGSGTSYYSATTKAGVIYDCEMEGGSIVTFGVHNPPTCKKRGT